MPFNTIHRLYDVVYRNFTALFWPVFAVTFIVAFLQLKDQTYLQNDLAPRGIISLELGRSRTIDSAIVQSWRQDSINRAATDPCQSAPLTINRTRRARTDVYADFLFILLYTTLGIIIIAGLQARIKQAGTAFSNILLLLPIVAGICDIIENAGMLRFIQDGIDGTVSTGSFTAGLTRTMALVKFGILGFLLCLYIPYTLIMKDGGLQWLSAYIRAKTLQLFRYRVIIVSILAFTTPIWMMDQGQDLLVNSNSSDTGVMLFIVIVLVAAFLHWWLAKLFFEDKYKGPVCPMTEPAITDPERAASEKKVSRYLGVITILLPATAILNALQVLRIPFPLDIFPPVIWLIALLSIFFVLIRFDIAKRIYGYMYARWGSSPAKFVTIGAWLTFGFVLPVLIRYLVLGDQGYTPQSLFWLFFHLLLLALAFWIFVSTRGYIFNEEGWWCKKIGWPIILGSGALAVSFVIFNISPFTILRLDCNYLTLPVLLSGIIFYIMIFTLLIRISLWLKINLVLFIVTAGLVIAISIPNDYHAVRLTPKPATPSISLNDYFRNWLLHRKNEILNAPGEYPVFLVNTYGGGIKAAAFTNMVFSYLDSTLIHDGKEHKGFGHYAFSVSGASGGTIGAAVQCAYRARYLDSSAENYSLSHFQNFYKHDFLTPVLGNMIGRDVWASVAGYPLWRDRSAIQEGIWEGFGHRTLDITLDNDFNAIWDTTASNPASYEVPLLFSNTLNVDDGLKGIMAPVVLTHSDFPGTIFIQERVAALNAQRKKERASPVSISLMTGAFLSARFPFISPSGKIGPGYHFMDGGGKDNSGASTSESIFISLARQGCRKPGGTSDSLFSQLIKKVRFYFVSITNSPYYNPDNRQLVSNRFEPISPLVGLVNSGINGNAQAADNTLQFRYNSDSTQFPGIRSDYSAVWITATCVKDGKGRSYTPVLPLGWQISAPSLERMSSSFSQEMIKSYNKEGIRKILAAMASLP